MFGHCVRSQASFNKGISAEGDKQRTTRSIEIFNNNSSSKAAAQHRERVSEAGPLPSEKSISESTRDRLCCSLLVVGLLWCEGGALEAPA